MHCSLRLAALLETEGKKCGVLDPAKESVLQFASTVKLMDSVQKPRVRRGSQAHSKLFPLWSSQIPQWDLARAPAPEAETHLMDSSSRGFASKVDNANFAQGLPFSKSG